MWLNSDASKGALADPRFHWAVSYLLDRKKIGSTVWLIETPPAQYPWADYKSNDVWTDANTASTYPMTYDPAKAASMLDDMGAKKGSDGKRTFNGNPITIEIMTPTTVGQPEYEIGQLVADELTKLGITASIRAYSNPVWTQKWNTGQFDISSHWLCGVSFDPDQLYTTFEIPKLSPIGQVAVNGNNVRLSDKALSDLAIQLDSMNPTSDQAKSLFVQALGEYYKALPAIPIIQTTYPTIFNTTYWTNWPTDDNLYEVPANWWGQFLFVVGALKPTGHA
jgi:peptide/nickel transport system substrate-binding protein